MYALVFHPRAITSSPGLHYCVSTAAAAAAAGIISEVRWGLFLCGESSLNNTLGLQIINGHFSTQTTARDYVRHVHEERYVFREQRGKN